MMPRSVACALALVIIAAPLRLAGQGPMQAAALDRANLDVTCAPCADFYQFANGGWLKRTTIPAAYPQYGSFQQVYDRNEAVLHDILEKRARQVRTGALRPASGPWKVGAFYATCMDTAAIDRRGVGVLSPDLNLVGGIHSVDNLVHALAELERRAGAAPWSDGSTQDSRDAANTIAGLYQGGLSLPNNEYYSRADSTAVSIRMKFVAHMARMFQLAGDPSARAAEEANTVLAIETRVARASRTVVQLRDVVANYHRMTVAQVDSLAPHMAWVAFYRALGVPSVERVDVGQPEFFAAMDTMLTTVPLDEWRTYLRWRVIHGAMTIVRILTQVHDMVRHQAGSQRARGNAEPERHAEEIRKDGDDVDLHSSSPSGGVMTMTRRSLSTDAMVLSL